MANLFIKLNQCDKAIQVLNPLPLEVKVMPMANVSILIIIISILFYTVKSLVICLWND